MKPVFLPVLLVALSPAAMAGSTDLFRPQSIPSLPLSLADSARTWLDHELTAPFATLPTRPTQRPAKLHSAMPIVPPAREIDPKFVHQPDDSIDYKMIVIPPKIETTGEQKR